MHLILYELMNMILNTLFRYLFTRANQQFPSDVEQVKDTLIPILPVSVQKQISSKIDESFSNRKKSKRLLDIAKHGVEMAIEKSEEEAERWINAELTNLVK